MTLNTTSKNYDCNNLMSVLGYLLLSGAIALMLAGCTASGDGGPVISSLSAPTDGTEDATSDPTSDSIAAQHAEAKDSSVSPSTDATAGLTSDLGPEPPPSEEGPMIAMTSTATEVTARLTWDPSPDTNTAGYYVYYGKQPSGELGSCAYEQSQAVEAPPITITGLEPNTPYYFAISAFGEAESPCSIELMMVAPPVNG